MDQYRIYFSFSKHTLKDAPGGLRKRVTYTRDVQQKSRNRWIRPVLAHVNRSHMGIV